MVGYRAVLRGGRAFVEAWPEPLAIGKPLPTVPLWIAVDLPIPVPLDQSYRLTCESLRIRAR